MAPRTTKAGKKINQGSLVVHPEKSDEYIGFTTRHGNAYRGYVFTNPRKLHLALRPNPNVLAEPTFSAPKLSAVRFRMKIWWQSQQEALTNPSEALKGDDAGKPGV